MTEFEQKVIKLLTSIDDGIKTIIKEASGNEEQFEKELSIRKQELALREKEVENYTKKLNKD